MVIGLDLEYDVTKELIRRLEIIVYVLHLFLEENISSLYELLFILKIKKK